MKNRIVQIIIIVLVVACNVAVDQVSKGIARTELKGRGTIEVLGSFFVFTYAENEGAFLSFGSNFPKPLRIILLSIIPAICLLGGIIYIIYSFVKKKMTMVELICISCIIGGGIGNIYDRIFNGGLVTDFMNLGIGSLRTGIFNFADLSILLGAIALMIYFLFNWFVANTSKSGRSQS
ncbi:MAG: signal peptidase II [Spirochaetales bacterium]|nr:signal peptidase II [Spirochaetales bacterium]